MIHEGGRMSMGFSGHARRRHEAAEVRDRAGLDGGDVQGECAEPPLAAFWLIAPFAFAYVRFLKYDVR